MSKLEQTPEADLGGHVRRGLGWSFTSSVLSRAGTFLSGVVLARILVPTDYGAFTVALVAMTVLVNLNDLGIEQNLVRWPGDVDRIGPTAVTLMFGFSVVLYVVWFLGAGVFARAMGAPQATSLVQVLALGVLINGAFAAPSAMLTRQFRQGARTAADLTGFFVGTGLTLVLAVLGAGAWALVWGRVCGNGVVSVMHMVLTPRRFRPGWDNIVARDLLRTGLPIAGATIVAVAVLNVDYVIVGHVLGLQRLGEYTLAFNLASWPVTFFAVSVARVSVAAFGRLQNDPIRLRAAFDKALLLLAAATLPVCILIGLFARPLIEFVYGSIWLPAASVLPYLAALGLLRVVFQLWADLLVAKGSGSRVLVTQGVWLVALIIGIGYGAQHGLAGVGLAHLVVASALVLPTYLIALKDSVRPFGAPARAMRVLGAALGAALIAAMTLRIATSPFVHLFVGGSLFLGTYLALLMPLRTTVGVRLPPLVRARHRVDEVVTSRG